MLFKGIFRTLSINLLHMLHNCHKQKATSQTNYMSARGRKHMGAATPLDGWQNETTERKQITLCQWRRQKHPKGRRWSRLTRLPDPTLPRYSSQLLVSDWWAEWIIHWQKQTHWQTHLLRLIIICCNFQRFQDSFLKIKERLKLQASSRQSVVLIIPKNGLQG